MPTIRTTGDLFDLGLPALAHGCNCRGSMAGGIALEFQARWPEMAEAYRRRCLAGEFQLGDVMPWETPEGLVVYNLGTQVETGADARLSAIDIAVRGALLDAERRGLAQVGVPRIGAGIGGLEWADVRAVLEQAGEDSPVELVVVTRPR
ncbi:macro domain-containing protein [Paenibacillus sp. TRM 82003]|uniref:macro domain-containing protein n=1 Tax=Kineococcus sp. TRM81007 TaxID=2925831 RepID=UPI001F55D7A7|nr:macro domain-containing protein [Kineococcus sp. TRM81007]MCI2237057.1 macro domain-containing protein [Kineococcus sp. TRM81007]MCI3926476.1 macro domain-containing protein [Paenibacillus sp. TRM 82003]